MSSSEEPAAMRIADREVGAGRPALVIAEVAQAHDGSLGLAHAFVDAIADAGADAVKFQTHVASAESTREEAFRVPFSQQDATRFSYWERTGFTFDAWAGLAAHTAERGLLFLSSPFSLEAVDLLERLDVPAWKVASGEAGNTELIERMATTGKPLILSSGLSSLSELDAAVELARGLGAPVAVLQATTAYPTPPEQLGLNVIAELHARYGCPVGISDHSGTIYGGLGAIVLGANIVEVHATLSREMFGPDVSSSVTTAELRSLVDGIRFLETALRHPVDKDAIAAELAPVRTLFTRSLAPVADLPAGTVLSAEQLTRKKPGTGISPDRLDEVVGRTLRRDVHADELLREDDLA